MKTEAQKIARIASIMAVSNMGHLHNIKIDRVTDPKWGWGDTARYDVCHVAGHLMECDDHEEMFGDEAQGWEENIRELGIEEFIKTYSNHEEWIRKVWSAE